ncbi:hypothetical protein M9H77_04242 [Catharanthus roseus]|uniref:Uncharacterized protein n=1 Tax=Catharanthus roseus TaxID=4058 RepID=A0ACC0CDJ4_CATRO|nr:hypothetical protein M9H77_04242 [Catharanthus roseus]
MESKMRDLTSLLQEISTGLISNVQEVRRLIKGFIHPVLPDDPCQLLKIGKSSGSGSSSDSGSSSGSNPIPRGRGRPPRACRNRGRGCSSSRSSLSTVVSPDSPPVPFPFKNHFPGFRVVSNFLFGDQNHWVKIRRRMSYDLWHHMHVHEQLFGSVERVTELIMQTNWEEGSAPREYWMNTPDHLYVIANTFNLCVRID